MSVRIGELLVRAGLVDEAHIVWARAQCPDVRVGSALIITRTVSAEMVNRFLAHQHGLPAIALSDLEDCDPAARELVPQTLSRRLHAIPISLTGTGPGRTLRVAMRDPGDLSALDQLAFASGAKVEARIAPEIYLRAALERGGPRVSDANAAAAASAARDASDAPATTATAPVTSQAPRPRSSPIPLGPDPYAPSIVGRALGLAIKLALVAGVVIAAVFGYRTCFGGNTHSVGTHYASKALGVSIDFPDIGWRIAPAIGKKVTTARAEYFYRGNAPEFPIVGMLLVRSPNNQAAASAAESLLRTIIRNPKLRGCEGSDSRTGAIMCLSAGALELFGMVRGVVASVEVHVWTIGSDVVMAGMIQPDKTTTETRQILTSITDL